MARSLRSRLVTAGIAWTAGVALVIAITLHLVPQRGAWAWRLHFAFPLFMGLSFIVAGVIIVRRGLRPFSSLRVQLADIRAGRASRLAGDYPAEVAPLVTDLNALLEEREARVARAVARAGDLAHGMKTPLAILAREIATATAAGKDDLASTLSEQVERMRRQIDAHLSQARAAAGAPPAVTPVRAALDGLVRTMARLYEDRALEFVIDVDPGIAVSVPLEDLEELIGNLLDNACKWTRRCVAITALENASSVALVVEDDGPGLPRTRRLDVLERGVRADEAAPGSGLGLAIVRDLAGAYGGSIALDASARGGLRATLTLPVISSTP